MFSLNLQGLNLSGEISSSICLLHGLTHLNLASNFFNQPIPLHLSQCTSLKVLNISGNLIWGTIPDQISQFGSIKVLDFSRNHIEGKIPESIGLLRSLQVLNFGSNLLSGNVPPVLGNFSEMVVLDMSENPFLVSEIPGDIGQLDKLELLLLQSSGFYGEITKGFFEGLKSLSVLDLSGNNLTGELPKTNLFPPNLVSFDVSQNQLSGSFPNYVCKAKGLLNLGLHTNFFNGSIPNDSIKECTNLERFLVQNNMYNGNFPSLLWEFPKIKVIRAENNNFSGQIPDSISKAVQLEQVQIDNNSFVSQIPEGLGLVSSLYRFSASHNLLYGELPPNFSDSPVMSIMNLSHNHLSGEIPELKACRKLVSLSLADNNFEGKIPKSLADLPVLTYLDLSHNNLTGSLPQGLENLKLALFNISFNHLSGPVPSSLISGLPASFLEGNPDFCGPGFSNPCETKHKFASLPKFAIALICIAIVATIAVGAIAVHATVHSSNQKPQTENWHSVFFYPLRINEHDLLMSMNDKARRGKDGVFGNVYIIELPSGEHVAVKKLVNFGNQSMKSLKAEVKTLAKIRHKNIVKILGFCYSNDSILLIYEHVVRGSLGDMIDKAEFELPWGMRLKIAIGMAQGLAYLHRDYVPHLLHRNVKSRNVLLEADFEPKLTDFSLDRVLGEASFLSTLSSESKSPCYLAPEFAYTKKATEVMDTYSFGIVLLEIVTGRQAEEATSTDSLDVVKWVRRKVNITNGAMQVLDQKIPQKFHQEMLRALEIALQCTSVNPEKRPAMTHVLQSLQSITSKTSFS